MTLLPRRRICYTLGFLACSGLMAFALFLQYSLGEDPCPLCIFQRLAFMALGFSFLVAALHNPQKTGSIVYAILHVLTTCVGAAIAARQVWLQHLPPDQVPSCGPGLSYILQANPLFKALSVVLSGSGECAQVGWTLFSLSIAQWALMVFIILGVWAFVQPLNRR